MEDNKFDLRMRSILENGSEEVPAGLWNAVEGRLPSAAPGKAAVIWWPWISGAAAAAAAVVLALVFTGRKSAEGAVGIVTGGQVVAEAVLPEKTSGNDGTTVLTENVGAERSTGIGAIPAGHNAGNNLAADAAAVQTEDAATQVDTVEDNTAQDSVATSAEDASAEDSVVTAEQTATEDASAEDCVVTAEQTSTEDASAEDSVSTTEETSAEDAADNGDWLDRYDGGEFDENGSETAASGGRRPIQLTAAGNAATNSGTTAGAKTASFLKKPVIPKVTSIEERGPSSYMIPVSAGIGIRIPLAERWALGTGVNWSLLTRTFPGQYNKIENGEVISQNSYSAIRNTQNYIGIPVDVYFSIIRKDFIDFYAYAGGSANACLDNKYLMTGLESRETYNSGLKGWQFSAGVGLGVEFLLGQHLGLYLDPSLDYWFSSKGASNLRRHQPLTLGLELGLRFRL